jgi:maleate isomerase
MSVRHELAYAPRGLIGVLTPQANTTVEPEFSILTPPGFAFINARLTSDESTIEARLVDYANNVERQLEQFSNAPLDAVAFATTGASYLIGADAEDALVERLACTRQLPLVTTAQAVCDALEMLGAKTIGLVSPYPDALTAKSVGYWESRGFRVADIVSAYQDTGQFHPIYALTHEHAAAGAHKLSGANVEAIVMLGTGMPTLPVIAANADAGGPPLLSCMLALVWRSILAAAGRAPESQTLRAWLSAAHWRHRL